MISFQQQQSACRQRKQAYRQACPIAATFRQDQQGDNRQQLLQTVAQTLAATVIVPTVALAVAGGGGLSEELSYQDLSGRDFTGMKLTKVVMRGARADGANFSGVSLFGCKANDTSFVGANLTGSDMESGYFENADFTDALLEGAIVTNANFTGVKVENSDWTDVLLRKDQQIELCSRAKGVNPVTQVDTRESLACR